MPTKKLTPLMSSHKAVKDWAKDCLGRDAKPIVEGVNCRIEFSFQAGGHYNLNCLLVAGEPDGMLTLSGSAFLNIPNQKEREVLTYCSQHSNAAAADRDGLIEEKEDYHGLFNIFNGTLIYLHSRPVKTEPGDVQLINLMLSRMDSAVSAVAEGILEIVTQNR